MEHKNFHSQCQMHTVRGGGGGGEIEGGGEREGKRERETERERYFRFGAQELKMNVGTAPTLAGLGLGFQFHA